MSRQLCPSCVCHGRCRGNVPVQKTVFGVSSVEKRQTGRPSERVGINGTGYLRDLIGQLYSRSDRPQQIEGKVEHWLQVNTRRAKRKESIIPAANGSLWLDDPSRRASICYPPPFGYTPVLSIQLARWESLLHYFPMLYVYTVYIYIPPCVCVVSKLHAEFAPQTKTRPICDWSITHPTRVAQPPWL